MPHIHVVRMFGDIQRSLQRAEEPSICDTLSDPSGLELPAQIRLYSSGTMDATRRRVFSIEYGVGSPGEDRHFLHGVRDSKG